MQRYKNLSRNSGVIAFENKATAIAVKFRDGTIYDYTYEVTGRKHVEHMKMLAKAGLGLSTYISRHIKGNYAAAGHDD